jgi:hypothetical protein
MIHNLGHILLHMGPGLGMIVIIVWAMWRTGQLSDPDRAGELPLLNGGPSSTPDSKAPSRRIPMVALTLALLMGIGLGLPIAAVVVGSRIHVSTTQHGGAEGEH